MTLIRNISGIYFSSIPQYLGIDTLPAGRALLTPLKRIPIAVAVVLATACSNDGHVTNYDAMMEGKSGWKVTPVFTVGESVGNYTPPGIIDGIGALKDGNKFVTVLANHELTSDKGYPYMLGDGTEVTGSRISYFKVKVLSGKNKVEVMRGKGLEIVKAGIAYDKVMIPAGETFEGFNRLCSSRSIAKGDYGMEDNIYLTGEETTGGYFWALDVDDKTIWKLPSLGRGNWENLTPLDTANDDYVAFALGDDAQARPLYLYIGKKNPNAEPAFLQRNGLVEGQLYVWKSATGETDPEAFNGTGSSLAGSFVKVGSEDANDMFLFSRPEDLHDDPSDGTRFVFASTGHGSIYPSDDWGALYVVDADLEAVDWSGGFPGTLSASIDILYDGDDADKQDFGIRSPDNLVWSETDGNIYVQEDRSTKNATFGGTSGREASIWSIDPDTGALTHVAEMDRSVVAPAGSTDGDPTDLGDWESSGILDVSDLFGWSGPTPLLIGDVQAHSVRDGDIGGDTGLVQGGQLIFIQK